MSLPMQLTIIGVGGCGKKLLHKVCEHDWFLKTYLQEGRSLKLLTYDTDASQSIVDNEKMANLKKHTDELRREMKETMNNVSGSIGCEHYDLPTITTLHTISDLKGRDIANAIKQRTDVDCWWINDIGDSPRITYGDLTRLPGGDNLASDFSGGVYRMRAISKAIYYKAKTIGNRADFIQCENGGPVVIIVGLGGGTGSGMFIDLARDIRRESNPSEINVIGILPDSSEGDEELLNASIALTELEYLNTHVEGVEDKLFKHIFLTSLEPTKNSIADREDYDLSFPYLLLNTLDHDNTIPLNLSNTKKYCGFISADAYVIEYPVAKLQEIWKLYSDFLKSFDTSTTTRQSIVNKLGEYYRLDNNNIDHSNDAYNKISSNSTSEYRMQITKIRGLLSPDVLNGFHSGIPALMSTIHSANKDLCKNIDTGDNFKKLHDYVKHVSKHISGDTDALDKVCNLSDKDIQFKKLIAKNFEILDKIGDYYLYASQSKSVNIFRAYIEVILGLREIKVMNSLNADLLKLEGVRDNLNDQRTNISKSINTQDTNLHNLCTLKNNIEELNSKEMSFVSEYNNIMADRDKKLNSSEKISKIDIDYKNNVDNFPLFNFVPYFEILNETERLALEKLDKEITNYYYYQYMIKYEGNKNIVSKIIEKNNKQAYESSKKTAISSIQKIASEINNVTFRDEPFSVIMKDGIFVQRTRDQIASVSDDIVNDLSKEFNLDDNTEHILKDELSSNSLANENNDVDNLKNKLSKIILSYLDRKSHWTNSIATLVESDKNDAISLDNIENAITSIKSVNKLFEDTTTDRLTYNENVTMHTNNFSKIKDRVGTTDNGDIRKYRAIVGDLNPTVLPLLTDDIMHNFNNNEADPVVLGECDKIYEQFNRNYPELISHIMLGLNNLHITGDDDTRWNFLKSIIAVNCDNTYILNKIHQNTEGIRQNITRLSYLSFQNDAILETIKFARDWECAFSFYGVATCLDNLSEFSTGRSYRKRYDREKHNILHHVLYLENGQYIVRKSFFDKEGVAKISYRECREELGIDEDVDNLYELKDIKNAFNQES